jgi:hypothetical protein
MTADTQRHMATFGDSESWAERRPATSPDTIRHAGLGLHSRRAPVRFLFHLPLSLEFMGFVARRYSAKCVCVDPDLTQSRTTKSNTANFERDLLMGGLPATALSGPSGNWVIP